MGLSPYIMARIDGTTVASSSSLNPSRSRSRLASMRAGPSHAVIWLSHAGSGVGVSGCGTPDPFSVLGLRFEVPRLGYVLGHRFETAQSRALTHRSQDTNSSPDIVRAIGQFADKAGLTAIMTTLTRRKTSTTDRVRHSLQRCKKATTWASGKVRETASATEINRFRPR